MKVPLRLAVLAATAIGCVQVPQFEAKPLEAEERLVVGEQIRGYAKTHCGSCHQSTLPTANPAALKIYDLDADNWSSTLTAEQLRGGFPRRLNGRLDGPGREQLKAFIESELALRAE